MITVVYTDNMVGNVISTSPSAGKPKLVVDHWLATEKDITVVEGRAATIDELCTAHSPDYVADILNGTAKNGFGTKNATLAESFKYTVGGMLTAVDMVAAGSQVVCVPVSGFHHAGYQTAEGYCTFNGLVVASEYFKGKVAIVDCDMHYGNGTEEILKRIKSSTLHFVFGRYYGKEDAIHYLTALRQIFNSSALVDVELIIYQAGADVHLEDPLGGVLNTEQMIERDHIVFEGAKAAGIPIIWNLAGGYQTPVSKVIDLHTNTLDECVSIFKEKNYVDNS